MTKSDRKRVEEALARYEARFRDAYDKGPDCSAVLAAAVDWLRAECRLIDRFLDDDGRDWSDQYIVKAAMLVHSVAVKTAGEIRAELGK